MKILFAGESWMSYGIHVKGFNAYYTGGYEEGGEPLLRALEDAGNDVTYIRNHDATRLFPNTVEELQAFDVVVLSDIGADTFLLHPDVFTGFKTRPNPLVAISEYVEHGGGFLMVGGYMSFSGYEGKANYHNTALADLLPVALSGVDDRVERPEGCTPALAEPHPSVDGIPEQWPHFLGYNKLSPKAATATALRVGNDPFLVLGEHGGGRTAAFASDCAPHWGTPEFVEWSHYGPFWNRLTRWLAGAD